MIKLIKPLPEFTQDGIERGQFTEADLIEYPHTWPGFVPQFRKEGRDLREIDNFYAAIDRRYDLVDFCTRLSFVLDTLESRVGGQEADSKLLKELFPEDKTSMDYIKRTKYLHWRNFVQQFNELGGEGLKIEVKKSPYQKDGQESHLIATFNSYDNPQPESTIVSLGIGNINGFRWLIPTNTPEGVNRYNSGILEEQSWGKIKDHLLWCSLHCFWWNLESIKGRETSKKDWKKGNYILWQRHEQINGLYVAPEDNLASRILERHQNYKKAN